jgi:protein-S-isoprenylcysteine O-methyltransferase Ste14
MKQPSFGSRGEWWVVAQFVVIPILLIATIAVPLGSPWLPALSLIGRALGVITAVFAAWLLFRGVVDLGRNLTPNPKPIDDGQLVQTGAYAVVRHPIYAGLIFGMLAIGLFSNSLMGVLSAVILFAFFDLKSRKEEQWLSEKYSEYEAYRRKTRKLIPLVY